jgi:phage shock protein PspC (stress-responsive transcriptional regulator)
VGREHRALHDVIAGTAVVYGWDARAARLRFLAREAEPGAGAGRAAGSG